MFDNIAHNKLLHNIKKRRIFRLLFKIVKNFLKNRYIIITIDSYTTIERNININILQNFPLLLILYLFYNANLLKIYNNIKLRISFIKFVNNINILIYKKSIKQNCRILNKIYNRYK